MPQDQDLQYLIRVQDQQLKELMRNLRAINKEIAHSETVSAKSGAGVSRSYAQADAAAGRSLKSIAKAGLAFGAGFATFQAGQAFVSDSVKEAGELAVQVENVGDVFEGAADEVLDWSETTAGAIRVSRLEALKAVGVFGAMFESFDVPPSRAAEFSQEVVEIGNALAQLKGTDPSELLDRVRTALSGGRAAGLRAYGIALTKVRTEQVALAMSGKESVDQLTDQDKALARYQILLEDTAGVQRKAAESAHDWSGETKELGARIRDLKADLGGFVIGGTLPFVKALNQAFANFDDRRFNQLLALKKAIEEGEEPRAAAIRLGLKEPIVPSVSGLLAAFDAASAEIEKKLRTRLGDALEDVHDKALRVFDRETDALVSAHDRVTDDILDAFDKTSDEMLERMKVLVSVGERQFEIGRGELTPAERELEALEKVERKRNVGREIVDAKEELAQALIIGDPAQIRDAQRRLQDAEAERKKIKLEGRAKTEREAADKVLEAEEEQLRESRDNLREGLKDQRTVIRDDLADRRRLQRGHLDSLLTAQEEALEKGKIAAGKAQTAILATLRKFGVEYEGVGKELGERMVKGLIAGMTPPKAKKDGTVPIPGGTWDPKTGQVTITLTPTKKGPGAARGGIAGTLGAAGASDTIPAWLTPGEMILTSRDQRSLARMLGTSTTGGGLLSQIRMGFAEGGIADEDLFRELLERFSQTLGTNLLERIRFGDELADRYKGGRGFASKAVLTGKGITDAERRLFSPLHVQSLVKHQTTAAQRAELGVPGLRELYMELSQRQAHPKRSGLVRVVGGNYSPGGDFRDPMGGGTRMSFGDINANFPNVSDGYEAFEEMRRMFLRHQRRNSRRRRGRNKERGL